MKILVVDDHPLIREAMQHVLADLDTDVVFVEAGDTDAALAALVTHSDVDLVLLDLGLPGAVGMSGLDAMRQAHPDLPVVVLSASDDPTTVLQALDHGAMGFIPKCSSNTLIVNALRLVMSGGVYVPPQAVAASATQPQAAATPAPQGGKTTRPEQLGLTSRQSQVLALMVQGKPNKAICRELDLAEGTVKIHVTAILKALGVINRTQAVIAASRLGLKFGRAKRA